MSDDAAADTIEAIEAVTRAALTADEQQLDGWWLRSNPALPNSRPNSATTPVRGAVSSDAVDVVVGWYRARSRAPRVRVLSVSDPIVDRMLDEQGWSVVAPTRVMTKPDLTQARPGDARVVTGSDAVPVEFVGIRQELGLTATAAELALGQPDSASLFGFAPASAAPVATGRAVLAGVLVGMFDVVTLPAVRRRGWGSAVVQALLVAARSQGATLAFLQVEEANRPAIAMYEALGFATLYTYHYREPPGHYREPPGRFA